LPLKQHLTGLGASGETASPSMGEGSLIPLHMWLEIHILFLKTVNLGRGFSFNLKLFGKILIIQQSTKAPFSRLREKGRG
jgi:hypothetical protein